MNSSQIKTFLRSVDLNTRVLAYIKTAAQLYSIILHKDEASPLQKQRLYLSFDGSSERLASTVEIE